MPGCQLKAIPIQKTLLAINNFVVNTTNFLNSFSDTCERKIYQISSRVNELEILLSVLEAKLDSIPGLDGDAAAAGTVSGASPAAPTDILTTALPPQPQPQPSTQTSIQVHEQVSNSIPVSVPALASLPVLPAAVPVVAIHGSQSPAAPPPPPPPSVAVVQPPTAQPPMPDIRSQEIEGPSGVVSTITIESTTTGPSGTMAKDHPTFAPFFKMLKVGIPMFVVQTKMSVAGLDGAILETPDAVVPE